MKTYTDAKVREAFFIWMKASKQSYRECARELQMDFGCLHRMVNGKAPVSEWLANAMGFEPVSEPRRWVRWQDQVRSSK